MTPPDDRELRLPKRILMTTDAVGGVWDYALELGRGLARAGIETVLAILGPPANEAQIAAARSIAGLTVLAHDGRLEWMDHPWDDVDRASAWLTVVARAHAVELVHHNGYAAAAAPFDVPVLVVAHSCCLSWWQAVKRAPPPEFWRTYQDRVARGLLAATHVVAPTETMLAAITRHYGRPRSCEVIANGRDANDWVSNGQKAPVVLAAGRLWDEAKNISILARVAPRLPWPIEVAGDVQTADGNRERDLIPADKRLPNLVVLGRLPPRTLAAHFARAAIYALPALYEPFGLSVLEAALSGCALVLGDISSLRELWSGAALFVNPRDEDAVAHALTEIMSRPERRFELAHRARARAQEYSTQRMVAGYLNRYGRLLAGTPGKDLVCAS